MAPTLHEVIPLTEASERQARMLKGCDVKHQASMKSATFGEFLTLYCSFVCFCLPCLTSYVDLSPLTSLCGGL